MDEETEANKKERQIIKKIEIIHETFKSQTDPVALYATISYQEYFGGYVNDAYDENFDENAYKDTWETFKTDYDDSMAIYNNGTGDNCGENCINQVEINNPSQSYETTVASQTNKPNSIDLLTAATIVMLDSSGWVGSYNEENYQKALAGDSLVGSLLYESDDQYVQKFIASIYNGAFCAVGAFIDMATAGAGVDLALTGFNPTKLQEFEASNFFSNGQERLGRYFTMASICMNGFIGGVYPEAQNISNQELKQAKKDKIAQDIIDYAEYLRGLYGSNDDCLTGNTQTGDLSDMTPAKCAEKFGPMAQAEYSRTGIFASITLGQAWLESNCGKATPPNSNNLFGIKCSSNWDGECSYTSTGEEVNGGYITINAGFRVYPSVEEGIADHSNFFIDNERYSRHGVFTATNYAEQARAIKAAGYATASNYAEMLIQIIEENNFDKWDVKTNTTSSADICAPVGLGGWNIRTIAPVQSDSAFADPNSSTNQGGNVGQCVWYAQGRSLEIVNELEESGKLSADEAQKIRNLIYPAYGNGGDIYDMVKAAGAFKTSNNIREPKAGSYIVWKEPGAYGHVAVIEEVNTADNTITITEGWATGGASCPSDWSCVRFQNSTFDLDDFYTGYGQNYTGGYQFSGYVYFLEPL